MLNLQKQTNKQSLIIIIQLTLLPLSRKHLIYQNGHDFS